MRRLVNRSMPQTLELAVSDNNVAAAADRVDDWLETMGGLRIDRAGEINGREV